VTGERRGYVRQVSTSLSPLPEDPGEDPGTAVIPAMEAPTEAVRPVAGVPQADSGDRVDEAIDSVLASGRDLLGRTRTWLAEMDHRLLALTALVGAAFLLLVALA
jgi:hypothetical protein